MTRREWIAALLIGPLVSRHDILNAAQAGDLTTLTIAAPVRYRGEPLPGEKSEIEGQDRVSDQVERRLAGLLTLVQSGDAAPSAPQRAVAWELMAELGAQLARLTQLTPR